MSTSSSRARCSLNPSRSSAESGPTRNSSIAAKYWTVQKDAPLSPPLVQRPHPPFLVSAQSEESLRWAAQHDIPFAQIDSMIDQAKRDQDAYGCLLISSGVEEHKKGQTTGCYVASIPN